MASIDGLASGLDTTSLINALMKVEQLPQQQLSARRQTGQTLISALQQLNTKVAALADAGRALGGPTAASSLSATTSAASVTATVAKGAPGGSFALTIDRLAQSQVGVTGPMTTWPTAANGSAATLTLVDAAGKRTEVTPASTALADVVDAVNAAGGPATAVRVRAGTDADGTARYRLQFTATGSGTAGGFTLHRGTAADVDAGVATDLMTEPGAAVVTAAQDASARLYAGTAAEQVLTSSTTTFTGVLPGVDVTATTVPDTPVTVTVGLDTDGIVGRASALVDALNGVLSSIASQRSVSTSAAGGVSTVKSGVFTANSTVTLVNDRIAAAAYQPVGGASPATWGIELNRDGTFTFDEDTLRAALATDPAGTQRALADIAVRVTAAARDASAPSSGSLSSLIQGRQAELTDLTDRIGDWDVRLAARRESLQALFNAMEGSLGALQSQQSWLTSQIASLPTPTPSSSSR
ncbi:flagellar hook-associated protein 2 [Tersicoccus solisilvae]|uniref:Flagellar hook-associated protein 2 n=1 Tax=Tersicoccus solisilvae TaxID=1882339 RepID=A0ABQ1PI76_9MICC|nr:flagellar filament capping protein FliD [Tersicoccus solisilvae]GGC97575.1 flagellar hook-associated protein 2 [Tersicoccus solisilvae]